jgi:hypothetical protein
LRVKKVLIADEILKEDEHEIPQEEKLQKRNLDNHEKPSSNRLIDGCKSKANGIYKFDTVSSHFFHFLMALF